MRLASLLPVIAAASLVAADINAGCAGAGWNSAVDFFSKKWTSDDVLYPVTYNKTFITIKNRPLRHVVLHCTNKPPPREQIGDFALTVKIPVTSVTALDGLSQNIIDMLGMSSTISRVGESSTVTSACIRGNVADNVTYDQSRWNLAPASQVTFYGDSNVIDLSKVLIKNDGTMSPLQQAKYIRLIGMFYGLDNLAGQLYDAIASQYRCNAARVNEIIQQKQYSEGHFISAVELSGTNFEVSQGAWWQVLATDAGVQLVNVSTTMISPLEVEISASSSTSKLATDSWGLIDTTQYNLLKADAPRIDKAAWLATSHAPPSIYAVQNDNIFLSDKAFSPSQRHNFHDRAPARPDLLLTDLITSLYPAFLPTYTPTFLRPLTSPSTINDQRRLRTVCVAHGLELASLFLELPACTSTSPALLTAGLQANAYNRVAVMSDALRGAAGWTWMQIVGGVVGVALGVGLVGALVGWWVLGRRRARSERELRVVEKVGSVESLESVEARKAEA